jgi:YfiH family protein
MSLPELELPGGGRVLFTDRSDGNLSSVGGDGHEQGEQVRERLRRRVKAQALLRGYQVHGSHVACVSDPAPARDERAHADGQATTVHGLAPLALAADCLPVALAADGAVAMVHAGWRGLAAGVLEAGVAALRELGASGPLVAVIGPGAGACCYEVGPEVQAAFGRPAERGPIDLPAIAREHLLDAGVARVEDLALCTICDERFFSNRREGERAGRQGGVAWLS